MDPIVEGGGGTVVRLTQLDLRKLSGLCLSCSAFFELIEGQPPSEATAAEIVGPLEPAFAHGTKHVWGIEADGGTLVAAAELLQDHPSAGEWYIGLLLVTPGLRRNGIGSRFCGALMDWMTLHGATMVRLVVHHQNVSARLFWERQGFSKEREVVKRSGRLEGPVAILARSAGGG